MATLKVTVRVDLDPTHAIGPGKIALLEKMQDCGSLSQAARDLDMSYRRAWLLLDSLNRSFREPLVMTATGGSGGGGSMLTELGNAVVSAYRSFEAETNARAARHFAAIHSEVVSVRKGVRRPITKATSPVRRARTRLRTAR